MTLATARTIALIFALVVAGVYGIVTIADSLSQGDSAGLNVPDPDVPPLEYVYLDSARVFAYLGQVEQGLAMTETRTLTEKRANSASIKGENVLEVSANVERQRESQQVVSQTEADRFFTFLRILRSKDAHRKLFDFNAQLAPDDGFDKLRGRLGQLLEGGLHPDPGCAALASTFRGGLPRRPPRAALP